jgi:hypothetical protein
MRANAAHLASNRETVSVSSTPPADSTAIFDPIPIARCATGILNYLSTDSAGLRCNVRFLSAFVNAYWLVRHLDPLTPASIFAKGVPLGRAGRPKNNSLTSWIPHSATSCREIFSFAGPCACISSPVAIPTHFLDLPKRNAEENRCSPAAKIRGIEYHKEFSNQCGGE